MVETEFVVRTASARMPSFCWGRYARVAVLEVERGVAPKMISTRARGVVRVVATWERVHVGTTQRCAYQVALSEARALRSELASEGTL